MSGEALSAILALRQWRGDRGTYHLVIFDGEHAEALSMHARMHRLEFGTQRGFGSVKVVAQIGETRWKSSVFPQQKLTEWVLLVSKKVMRAESIVVGDEIEVSLELI